MIEKNNSPEEELNIDLGPALDAVENIFLDAKDGVVGVTKIVLGGTLALGGLCLTLSPIPGGIIITGLGGLIFAKGVEQAILKPLDR
jgi:hypothetical protein